MRSVISDLDTKWMMQVYTLSLVTSLYVFLILPPHSPPPPLPHTHTHPHTQWNMGSTSRLESWVRGTETSRC